MCLFMQIRCDLFPCEASPIEQMPSGTELNWGNSWMSINWWASSSPYLADTAPTMRGGELILSFGTFMSSFVRSTLNPVEKLAWLLKVFKDSRWSQTPTLALTLVPVCTCTSDSSKPILHICSCLFIRRRRGEIVGWAALDFLTCWKH